MLTDEMLARMRALMGVELRTDGCVNNEHATRLTIVPFAEGIGYQIHCGPIRCMRHGRRTAASWKRFLCRTGQKW